MCGYDPQPKTFILIAGPHASRPNTWHAAIKAARPACQDKTSARTLACDMKSTHLVGYVSAVDAIQQVSLLAICNQLQKQDSITPCKSDGAAVVRGVVVLLQNLAAVTSTSSHDAMLQDNKPATACEAEALTQGCFSNNLQCIETCYTGRDLKVCMAATR